MNFTSEKVALKYKELWQVEYAFRDMKSAFDTRPIFHQRNETIRGHVFCSFLALVLRKEFARRLEASGHGFEWSDIKQDLKALQETIIEDDGKRLAVRVSVSRNLWQDLPDGGRCYPAHHPGTPGTLIHPMSKEAGSAKTYLLTRNSL